MLSLRRAIAVWVAVSLLLFSSASQAGDAKQVWMTIETEHFVIHYYKPLDDVARRVASVAERSHRVLAPAFDYEPDTKTHIVISDETDGSNGFATVLPRNQIRLFATAPVRYSSLNDHDDWLYGLTAHEYTHILHLDTITGLPKIYNRILGKQWAPNQIQPRWVIEGIATYQESKRSSSGRTRQALFDMDLRVHSLAGKIHDLDAMSNQPRAWPHGRVAYQYGSHFLKYVFDRYGDDKLGELSWDYASNPIPWGINQSIERVTGRKFTELFDEWRAYMRDKYTLQRDEIERHGRREGRRLTFSGQTSTHPKYTPDGKHIVWSDADGLSRTRLKQMPVGGNVGKSSTYAVIDRASDFDMLPDGSIVTGVVRRYRSIYAFTDIHIWDRRTRRLRRLTKGERGHDPAVSPDGRWVTFARNGNSRRQLVLMPFHEESEPQVIWKGEHRYDQVATPAWSPDGKSIAFSAWRKGGFRDILIYDVESGKTRELMHDRAQDADPVYGPKGKYLYYASDRSGIYNVYAHEVATGTTRQVTNVLGCALSPDVSPDGKRLVYQGFDVGGYDLFEIELDPSRWLTPRHYINTRPNPVDIRDDEIEVSEPRPYRPLETLAPKRYTLRLGTNAFGQTLSLGTSASDVAGHHFYSVNGNIGLDTPRIGVGMSYSYRRLWPNLRIAAIRSTSRRTGVILDGINTVYSEENWGLTASLGFPVLRTTNGEGTLSFDYDLDWLRNVGDDFEGQDPNDNVPRYPETDVTVAAVALRWRYANLRRYVHRLGNQEGIAFGASIGLNHPSLGSDFHSLGLNYNFETYQKLPWGVTPTLAFRLAGGLRTTDRNRSGVFVLGGVPDQDIVRSVVESLRAGRTGFLRGFPSRSAAGRQFHLANIEYRQELWNIERGLLTLPFYVRRLHFAGLLDVGNAFNGEIDVTDFKVAVGGTLRLDMVFGYFVPGSLDIGYARGLTEGGISEYWTLLTGEL